MPFLEFEWYWWIAIVASVINLLIFIRFLGTAFYKSKTELSTEPFSIVVCARNEQDNLRRLIPLLQNQTGNWELILVDHSSYDDTREIIEEAARTDSRIRLVLAEDIEAFWNSKKFALTLGIKAATHDRIVFMDADCTPTSNEQCARMAAALQDKQLNLGYSPYHRTGSLLSGLVGYETLLTGGHYLTTAREGWAYMGVGRNMAYSKSMWMKGNGFATHMNIASGDDDLFVQQHAQGKNTSIQINHAAQTISAAPESYAAWLKQKRRHVTTAAHYKFGHKLYLGLSSLSTLFCWMVVPLVFWLMPLVPSIVVVSRFALVWLVMGILAFRLERKTNGHFWLVYVGFPLLELFLIINHMVIGIWHLIARRRGW